MLKPAESHLAVKKGYILAILVAVYTLNFVDRQILSILLEPIKNEMGFSDSALGFLTGFGFALFYATLGIPMAMWADRSNRRNIVALSLAIWSAMTALSGLVQNFWQLAIARIGVGVGEAGCSPASHSMIADLYSRETRATALGFYALGIPLGVLFGFITGGWINQYFGWRAAFFVVGLPGILLALMVRWTVAEPQRGQSDQLTEGKAAVGDSEPAPTVIQVVNTLMQKKAFVHMALGGSLTAFVGYGVFSWVPSFLIRSHAMATGEIGTWLGLILGIPGGVGILLGGYLADKLGKRDTRWYLWIVSAALVLAFPFSLGVYSADSKWLCLTFLIAPVVLGNFYQATTFAQTQGMVPLRMRATAAAILLFIFNIIGLGLGPQLIGVVSDMLAARFEDESLRYSLLLFSSFNLWAAYHYFQAGKLLPLESSITKKIDLEDRSNLALKSS
ncbi:MFS transporter [Halioxenophilus sp. WMMB6]|uniref:spinster family MFS transporter n=1 Tax=Halioxenophilus sp. WMMB6 TaxID=3073815 RepID=UPI00295E2EE4|nr:MFS transporter [Halioxenophilus sp. WMMB6]